MGLEETLGDGWRQVMGGLGLFLVGAIWGSTAETSIDGMFWPLVVMMLGALGAILGMSLGAGGAHGELFDLKTAVDDMTEKLNELQAKLTGGSDDGGSDDD
ncbi:MAG: hypothetical protein NZ770_05435, partial [Candidatus Poseidoniaceae archaeon]|nr:hypothetical protein [Candidatus Poseidoniaceae archaeon]